MKERAEGIKVLENINIEEVEKEESEVVQVQAKRAPGIGSNRKPSGAFLAQDDSRDVKRQRA